MMFMAMPQVLSAIAKLRDGFMPHENYLMHMINLIEELLECCREADKPMLLDMLGVYKADLENLLKTKPLPAF